jgi:RND family efflux transporter MFP subunit
MKEFIEKNYNLILIFLSALIILGSVFGFIFMNQRPSYDSVVVQKTDITQAVLTTGTVKSAEDLSLSFKKGGTLAQIKVKTGDKVSQRQILLAIDSKDASAAVKQATAALNAAKASYEKLSNGATSSEISVAEAAVNTAQVNLDSANALASKNLSSQYATALTTLNSASLSLYNTYTAVDYLDRNYFGSNDQEGLIVKKDKLTINTSINNLKTAMNTATISKKQEDIDISISQAITSLSDSLAALTEIRNTCNDSIYQAKISSTDKASIDTQKGYINTASTGMSQLQNGISLAKTQNQNSINSAQAALEQAQSALKLKQSPARQEDIDASKAQVDAAEATLQTAENAYADSMIRSPIDGIITNIYPKIGEVVPAGQPAVTIISLQKLQIETYVSETDLGKIKVQSDATITLDAYGKDAEFQAKVVSINPSATMSNGIASYKVILEFANNDDRLKTGMTANIKIIDQIHTQVIAIPTGSLFSDNSENFVLIDNSGKIQKKGVQTGLVSPDGKIEILSGLNEGDKIIFLGN